MSENSDSAEAVRNAVPTVVHESSASSRRKAAILVVGMHRSGTSALSRTLSLLGCTLPRTLLPGSPGDNDLGFWESQPIVDLNQEILTSAGSTWNDWRPFNPTWYSSPVAEEFRRRATAALEAEYGDSRMFVLKDPRLCRLLSFWLEATTTFGATPYVVSPIRNPLEVAASLEARNRTETSVSLLAWLRHVLDAEASSRQLPRSYIRYTDLVDHWQAAADRIARDLHIAWPRRAAVAATEIEGFLSPGHRRQRQSDESVFANRGLSRWIRDTYQILERWADDGVRPDDFALLDETRHAFDEATPAFELALAKGLDAAQRNRALIADVEKRERDLEGAREAARAYMARIDELESEAEALSREHDDWRSERETLKARIIELESEADALHSERDEWYSEREALETALTERASDAKAPRKRIRHLEKELASLHSSYSWRITAPVRAVGPSVKWIASLPRRVATLRRREPTQALSPTSGGAPKRASPRGAPVWAGAAAAAPASARGKYDALCAMLGHGSEDVLSVLSRRREDLRDRLEGGVLGQMVDRAGELEPLVHKTWKAVDEVRIPPFHSDATIGQMVAMRRLHEEAEGRRARAVVVIPHCRLSGATRIAGHLAHALAEIYGADELVVVRTDLSDMRFPQWFPDGTRHVDLACSGCSRTGQNLGALERARLLTEFLRSLRPETVFNVNSKLFWDSTPVYGKPLSSSMGLYTYLFCSDQDEHGHPIGYPVDFLHRCFDDFAGIVTDSRYLANDLRTRFQLPPHDAAKLVTLDTPIVAPPPVAVPPRQARRRRPQLYWAGRFDRQKRVDVVMELANRLPDIDFRLWGEPVLDAFESLDAPPNVSLEGVYRNFEELPLDRCDLWLYTSQWDGVPNILIEVAATGVPIVSSTAGGCSEVLVDGLCHRIESVDQVEAFARAIRAVLTDPKKARARALQLREATLAARTTAEYRRRLESLLTKAGARR